MRVLLIFFALILCFFSCKTEIKDQIGIYSKIDIIVDEDEFDILKFSQFFSDPELIKLETKDRSSLIGNVDNIEIINGNIFIRSGSNLYWFDESGNLKNQINLWGAGPGQCTYPAGLNVNFPGRELSVLANDKKSIITYSFEGSFTSDIRLPVYGHDFKLCNNGDILLFIGGEPFVPGYNDRNELIIRFDSAGRYIDGCLNKDVIHQSNCNNLGINDFYRSWDGSLYYKFPLFDTVYKFTDHTLSPYIVIDFNDKKVPPKLLLNENSKYYNEIKKNNFAYRITDFLETKSFYYFDFRLGDSNNRIACYYDKRSGKYKLFNATSNDYFGQTETLNIRSDQQRPVYSDSERFYFILEPYTLLKNLADLKNNFREAEYNSYLELYPSLSEISKSIKESDNPIILSVKPAI